MSRPGQLAAVVFDLDGLLVDSEPIQIQAWEVFLGRYGHALTPELLGRMFGLRVRDTARLVVEELRLPLSPEAAFRERDGIFFGLLAAGIQPLPGALEIVSHLRTRGLPLALATSGHRRYADHVLAALGLVGSFAAEVTGDDVAHGKPAPDIYLAAAAALSLESHRCLALEDAPFGVAAAKAAGLRCLAIPNAHTRGLAGLEAADAVLPSLHDALRWLETRGLLDR